MRKIIYIISSLLLICSVLYMIVVFLSAGYVDNDPVMHGYGTLVEIAFTLPFLILSLVISVCTFPFKKFQNGEATKYEQYSFIIFSVLVAFVAIFFVYKSYF